MSQKLSLLLLKVSTSLALLTCLCRVQVLQHLPNCEHNWESNHHVQGDAHLTATTKPLVKPHILLSELKQQKNPTTSFEVQTSSESVL